MRGSTCAWAARALAARRWTAAAPARAFARTVAQGAFSAPFIDCEGRLALGSGASRSPQHQERSHITLGIIAGYSGRRISIPMDTITHAESLGYDSVWTSDAYGLNAHDSTSGDHRTRQGRIAALPTRGLAISMRRGERCSASIARSRISIWTATTSASFTSAAADTCSPAG